MAGIMIVEDDKVIVEALEKGLVQWGFTTYHIEQFNEVLEQFKAQQPDLVLLDITLPYYNGYYWCTEIRKISKVPIIFLSSADEKMNIVMAINMGADDFISKPFDLDILVAKIQALIRRTYAFKTEVTSLMHAGVILNLNEATLSYQNQEIELTKNEFKILETLMRRPGVVITREELMKKLWKNDCFVDDNTLTVNMNRLRKKLEEQGIKDFIATKKGIGYKVVK